MGGVERLPTLCNSQFIRDFYHPSSNHILSGTQTKPSHATLPCDLSFSSHRAPRFPRVTTYICNHLMTREHCPQSQEFAPSRTGDTLTSEQQQDKALGDSAWRWQRVQDGTQYHTKEESRQMPVVVDTGMSAGQPGIEVDAKVAADARSSSLVTSLARTRMMVSRGLHSQPTKADQQGKDAAGGKGEPESVVTGREISDIDRRLGELHEFLKRAKAGGVPLPPPSPNKIVQQPLSKHNGDGDRTNEEGGHSPFVRPSSFGPMSALSMGENGGHHNSSHDRPLLPTSRTPHQLSEHTVSTKTIDLVPPVDAARG